MQRGWLLTCALSYGRKDAEEWATAYEFPSNSLHAEWQESFAGLETISALRQRRQECKLLLSQATRGVDLKDGTMRYLYRPVCKGIMDKYQIVPAIKNLKECASGKMSVDDLDTVGFRTLVDQRMNTPSYNIFCSYWNPADGTPAELRGM